MFGFFSGKLYYDDNDDIYMLARFGSWPLGAAETKGEEKIELVALGQTNKKDENKERKNMKIKTKKQTITICTKTKTKREETT